MVSMCAEWVVNFREYQSFNYKEEISMSDFSYKTDVHINAPIERVYRYLADFPRHVEWNHQPQAMTALTEGETAVGSQYRTEETNPSNMPLMQRIMMPLMRMRYKSETFTIAEITDLNPNKRVAWTAHAPNKQGKKLMQMHWELLLEEKNGGTQVTQSCEIDPPADSPFASMVSDDMVANGKAETARNLKRLKSILEA